MRALCLLAVFLLYQAVVTCTMHFHYDNGVVVEHSHPFGGQHSHSGGELLQIGNLLTPLGGPASVCQVPDPLVSGHAACFAARPASGVLGGDVRLAPLRAPPF